ncbi:hypothetical protein M5J14_22965 [Lysinibacillus sp. OL1_EC]|uniref:hypothetical protein n=1 Tax=unclassified Lysinibacillus TaxID=2636778 RepID=UPI00187D5E41|nr:MULTISPECIES: hypothetical protein [unclassified Lysinibacillus]MCM0627362.1 hypothetical protein [Lysinibacillus sp. OL1_EC]
MKLVYVHSESDVEVIAKIVSNHSISVEEAIELSGVNMDVYAEEQGWEGYDYNALKVIA